MSKRKVQFAEGADGSDDEDDREEVMNFLKDNDKSAPTKKVAASRFKVNTLDSDEEEDITEKVLDEDDIEGQEDGDVDYHEGEQRFTPFNMKDELDEGHFDEDGTYIFQKGKEIKDGWLDNIDWIKIKDKAPEKNPLDSDSDDEPEAIDEISIFKEMLELMKAGESVTKAMRRLGGSSSSGNASQRWKKKKSGETADPAKEQEEKANKEKMLKLTEFADKLLLHGNMEIYQDTYEKLQFKIKVWEEKESAKKTQVPEGIDEDDALDMFADNLDGLDSKSKTDTSKSDDLAEKKESSESAAPSVPSEGKDEESKKESTTNEVQWEFKWEEKDTEMHGPFISQQMLDWQEDDYFKDGCLVRKVGTETFYSAKRVDFDLYT